jgi:CHAT domain-containing protein/tetratricopeptide (TPR) repeat protein
MGFQRTVGERLDLFRRENLLGLEAEISRQRRGTTSAVLERMGDYFLERLVEGPIVVFRHLAVCAYRAALGAGDDGRLLFKLGSAWLQRLDGDREENVLEARRHLKAALECPPLSNRTDRITRGLARNSLGVAYSEPPFSQASQERDLAIECFQEALAIFDSPDSLADKANVLLNLGNLYTSFDPARAAQCYGEARQIYLDVGQWDDVARAEQNLGIAAMLDLRESVRADNVELALSWLRSSLSRISRYTHPYDYAVGLHNLGKAFAHRIQGPAETNFREGIRAYHEAGDIFRQLGHHLAARLALTGEGGLHYELREWTNASIVFDQAIALLENDWSEHATAQSRLRLARDQARLFDFAVLAAYRGGDTGRALEIAERGRNRVLAASYFASKDPHHPGSPLDRSWLEFQKLGQQRANLEQDLTLARVQRGDVGQKHKASVIQDLERCRLQQEALSRQMRVKRPDFLPVAAPLTFERVRRLPAELDATVWVLRPTHRGTLFFALHPDGEFQHEIIKEETTETLHELLSRPGGMLTFRTIAIEDWQAEDWEDWFDSMDVVLKELHERLITRCLTLTRLPVSELDAQSRPRLYVLAGGLLDLVPLHATYEEHDGRRWYLADVADVAYFSSFRLLVRALENSRRTRVHRLVAVEGRFHDLHYTRWEISVARSCFRRTRRRTAGTEAAFRKLLKAGMAGSALVVSCHAKSHTTDALRSGLFFKERRQWEALLTWNRFLKSKSREPDEPDFPLVEVLGADLAGCPLVLLNACETSLADFHDAADECLSLANAFIAAGAAAAIGTSWRAADVAAALWFARFLQQFRNGQPDALRAASAASQWIRDSDMDEKKRALEAHAHELVDGYVEDLAHDFSRPFFWASHKFHGVSPLAPYHL